MNCMIQLKTIQPKVIRPNVIQPKIPALLVTGSVGSGKTRLAKALSKKLNYEYIDVSSLIKKNRLYDSYDRKRRCFVVDIRRLNRFLINRVNRMGVNKIGLNKTGYYRKCRKGYQKEEKEEKKRQERPKSVERPKGIIIDSHLSHYLPRRYADVCIVVKCGLKELGKRLKRRGYSKSKLRENLECEIFDVCLNEAKDAGHNIMVIDTTKGINISRIYRDIKNKISKEIR